MADTDVQMLSITSRGEVSEDELAYATQKVSAVVAGLATPVLFAEVKLTREPDPARDRPSIAEAVLDIGGSPVRAHVAADRMNEAVDLLIDRLHNRIERRLHVLDDRRKRQREQRPGDQAGWHHGDLPSQRPAYFDRPVDDRRLLRRKSWATGEMTPDEAADALDLLGHDFFLFRNLVTGRDAVVFYADDHGLELIDASDAEDPVGPDTVAPITRSRLAARRCTTAEATAELDLGVVPFVFFVDDATGRGRVVYHRYDGHYGLITPP